MPIPYVPFPSDACPAPPLTTPRLCSLHDLGTDTIWRVQVRKRDGTPATHVYAGPSREAAADTFRYYSRLSESADTSDLFRSTVTWFANTSQYAQFPSKARTQRGDWADPRTNDDPYISYS